MRAGIFVGFKVDAQWTKLVLSTFDKATHRLIRRTTITPEAATMEARYHICCSELKTCKIIAPMMRGR